LGWLFGFSVKPVFSAKLAGYWRRFANIAGTSSALLPLVLTLQVKTGQAQINATAVLEH